MQIYKIATELLHRDETKFVSIDSRFFIVFEGRNNTGYLFHIIIVEFVLFISECKAIIYNKVEYVSGFDTRFAYMRFIGIGQLFVFGIVCAFEKRVIGIKREVPIVDIVCNLYIHGYPSR